MCKNEGGTAKTTHGVSKKTLTEKIQTVSKVHPYTGWKILAFQLGVKKLHFIDSLRAW